jgi:hypothetical protein
MENSNKMEQRKKSNLKILKIIGIIFGSLVLLGIFSNIVDDKSPENKTTTADVVVIEKGIEGMSPVDIYLDLEKKGYTIDKQYEPNSGTLYYCDKKDYAITYNVTMFKNTNDLVEEVKISATLTGLDNKNILAVKPFLKYISTVQYKGSDVNKVTQWVEDNFNNDKAYIIIGQAKFSIFAPTKFTRMVMIEKA